MFGLPGWAVLCITTALTIVLPIVSMAMSSSRKAVLHWLGFTTAMLSLLALVGNTCCLWPFMMIEDIHGSTPSGQIITWVVAWAVFGLIIPIVLVDGAFDSE